MKPFKHVCLALLSLTLTALAHAQVAAPTDPVFQRLPTRYNAKNEQGWKGNLGVGITITRGNSEGEQISGSFDAARSTPEDRILFHGIAVRNRTQEGTQADNAQANGRYERNVGNDWFGFGQADYERDVLRDLRLRQTYGLGAGNRLLQSDRHQLNVYAGLGYTLVDNITQPDSDGIEPFVGDDYTFKISDNASFLQRLVYYPDTVDTGGGRYVLEATINTKIYGAFGLQLTALQKYQQRVPPGRKSTDTVLFTGITVSF